MFQIFKSKGYLCWYCGKDAETLDHFIPKIKGGTNADDNLIPSCTNCNIRKRERPLEIFRDMETRRISGIPYFKQEQLDYLYREGFVFKKTAYRFFFEKKAWIIKN